jgi:hypothetical protein
MVTVMGFLDNVFNPMQYGGGTDLNTLSNYARQDAQNSYFGGGPAAGMGQQFNPAGMSAYTPPMPTPAPAAPSVTPPVGSPSAGMGQWAAFQNAMNTNYWGDKMPLLQGQAQQLYDAGLLGDMTPEQFAAYQGTLDLEHGFMDKMGGMKGLMGVGQLASTGMGIYNSLKQMQMQKDMFNAQKGIMNQNGRNQAQAYNTALESKMRNRDIATGGSYGGAKRAEDEKAVWKKV